MTKILELREKRAKAWKAAKAFLDTKRGNDGFCPPRTPLPTKRWRPMLWLWVGRSNGWSVRRPLTPN